MLSVLFESKLRDNRQFAASKILFQHLSAKEAIGDNGNYPGEYYTKFGNRTICMLDV